jgi:integrase
MSIYKRNDSKNLWTKGSHKGVHYHRSTGCEDIDAAKLFEKELRAAIVRKLEAQASSVASANPRGEMIHVITETEEKRYLLAAQQPLHDIAVIMLETGMRPHEVYTLERENVVIEKKSAKSGGLSFVWLPGCKAPGRKVYLTEKASAILQDRMKRFKGSSLFPYKDEEGNSPSIDIPVFEAKVWWNRYRNLLNRQHKSARAKSGTSFRLFDWRHTYAVRALKAGVTLLQLALQMGHTSLIGTTMAKFIGDSNR